MHHTPTCSFSCGFSAPPSVCLLVRDITFEVSFLEVPHLGFLFLQEGSSQARYLQSRLIPARKDPPYEQVGFRILLACLSEMFFCSF